MLARRPPRDGMPPQLSRPAPRRPLLAIPPTMRARERSRATLALRRIAWQMASDKHIDVAEAAEAAATEARLSQRAAGSVDSGSRSSRRRRRASRASASSASWRCTRRRRAQGLPRGAYDVMMQTRDHRSVAAPLALDEQDPAHLRDEQAAQIFWNVVIVELIVNAMTAQTDTETGCDELDASAANASGYNATASGCVGAGNLKVLTMIITGMFAAAMLIATALVCRVAFRASNKPSARGRRASGPGPQRGGSSTSPSSRAARGRSWRTAAATAAARPQVMWRPPARRRPRCSGGGAPRGARSED